MAAVKSPLKVQVRVRKRGGERDDSGDRFLKGLYFNQFGENVLFLFLRTQSLEIK